MKKLILLLSSVTLGYGQTAPRLDDLRLSAEIGSFSATRPDRLPFWQHANQFGIVPTRPTLAQLRLGTYLPYRSGSPARGRRRFDWGYGAELVVNATPAATLLIPELYVRARLGAFEVQAGRRRQVFSLQDTALSTGAYAWSGNALPVPGLQLAVPQFTAVPGTAGLLAFRGYFAHGWFQGAGERFIRDTYLHQKALYLRLGRTHWPIRLYGGFHHQAEWGGYSHALPGSLSRDGQLPATFSDYFDVVTGRSLGYRALVDTTRINPFDRANRIGNHLGTIDIGVEFYTRKLRFFLYRQSIFEDGSLYYLTNIGDGLNGLHVQFLYPRSRRFYVRDLLVEYLNTMSQGGPYFYDLDKFRGRDNYFNHSQYRDGWSYGGRTLGNPFLPPMTDTRTDLPRYGFTNNNRVQVAHIGIAGGFGPGFTFETKLSYSVNYGTYEQSFPTVRRQFSSVLRLGTPVSAAHGLVALASFGLDAGSLYDNALGLQVSLRKTWPVRRPRPVRLVASPLARKGITLPAPAPVSRTILLPRSVLTDNARPAKQRSPVRRY